MGGKIDDFEGKNTYDLFPEMARKYHNDDLEVINSGIPKFNIIEEYTPSSGNRGWVKTDKVPYTDPNSGKNNIIVISEDITTIKKIEEDLKINNEELKKFTLIASHDLQEPLRKIEAFGQILQTEYGPKLGEDAQLLIEKMTSSSKRMSTLIRDLLKYAKLNLIDDDFTQVNLNEILDNVLFDLGILIKETQTKITFDKLPTIQGHPSQLSQLFQNLINNSIKFSEKNSTPEINIKLLKDSESHIELEILDNGIGIPKEYAKKVFEPFKRLHSKQDFPGGGLGLAICDKIVKGHQGIIEIKNISNKGTCFFIHLPKVHRKMKGLP